MTRIPNPQEIGLPEKFSSWRTNQAEALSVMITSRKRVVAICAPTGFGKTLCVMGAAIMSGVPTCIVTNSRGLQDQYIEAFSEIGLVDIRGRRNYDCAAKPGCTCEDGHNSQCVFRGTINCPSSQAEMRAAASGLVVTNYAKWCSARKWGQGMSHFQQVIFDEFHEGPNALAQALQVVLNFREVSEHLKMDFPMHPDAEEFVNWKRWAIRARAKAEDELIKAQARITGIVNPKPAWIRHFTHMRNLARRLATISTASAKDWVVDVVETGYQFDPIRPARYAEAALLLKVPKIICVSATLRPKTLWMTGIGKESYQFKEFDSDFPPERCPIYYLPTMRVDNRAKDLAMLWLKLDQFAARRRDRKGLVHTISYARRDEIMARSSLADKMIFNPKGEPPTEMIEQFKMSKPGTILVSPSVGAGYDFPGSLCEWQFLCKVPFEPPSKIQKAREEDDPEYSPYRATQYMNQAVGRSMRSKEDQCETLMCDTHLDWFLPRYRHLMTRSFLRSFKPVTVLPPPPPRLTW